MRSTRVIHVGLTTMRAKLVLGLLSSLSLSISVKKDNKLQEYRLEEVPMSKEV